MYVIGSTFYGLYFAISFPMFLRYVFNTHCAIECLILSILDSMRIQEKIGVSLRQHWIHWQLQ
jgi:hypothetical protein